MPTCTQLFHQTEVRMWVTSHDVTMTSLDIMRGSAWYHERIAWYWNSTSLNPRGTTDAHWTFILLELSALSENIVKALRFMKSPSPLEPFQIQGYDFPAILLIINWLVIHVKVIITSSKLDWCSKSNRSFASLCINHICHLYYLTSCLLLTTQPPMTTLTSTLSLQHSHFNTLTSTLSIQHSHFNTLTSTLSLQLSDFNTLTSTLSLQHPNFNTLTPTL